MPEEDLSGLGKRLREALDFARTVNALKRSPDANRLWEQWYNAVPEPDGMLGSVIARAEAQVLRLSMLYALLDRSTTIDVPHLKAALALWDYAQSSAEYVFGDVLGDEIAERLLRELRKVYPDGVSRDRARDLFSGHASSERMTGAIERLRLRGLARTVRSSTEGRPVETIYALQRAESALSAESPAHLRLIELNALKARLETYDSPSHETHGEVLAL